MYSVRQRDRSVSPSRSCSPPPPARNRKRKRDSHHSNDSMDMLDEAGEQLSNYTVSRFQDVDFSNCPEEDTDDPDFCFLCTHGQSDAEREANDTLQGLENYIAEAMKKADPKTLCREAQRYYNEELRYNTKDAKVWRCQIIWEHIEKHAPTVKVINNVILRTAYNAFLTIRDYGLLKVDLNTGDKKIDPKELVNIFKLYQMVKPLLKEVGGGDNEVI